MEEVQDAAEKVRTFIGEGKSDDEIVQFLAPFFEGGADAAEALASRLASIPDEATVRILQRLLRETRAKGVQKAIKRSLYRLKARGVPVSETPPDTGKSVLRPLDAEPPEGFSTGFDPVGHRLLVLMVPRISRGMTVMHGLVSDTRGLINFAGEEMTRREYRLFLDQLRREENAFPLVKVEASYVALLFDEAYQRSLSEKKTPPQDYLHLKNEILKIKGDYEKPLIYGYFSREDVEGGNRLFKTDEGSPKNEFMVPWILEEHLVEPFAGKIEETRESKLFLNQAQREARFEEIYIQALSEVFTEERKRLYRSRLEETAYLFYREGKEEEAKAALSAAIELAKPTNPIQPSPFLLQRVIQTIHDFMAEAMEKREGESSLILKP